MIKLATEAQRERYVAFLMQQALPLGAQCEPWREPRTIPQNRYLWGAVYAPLVQRCGFEPEEWHEFFCIQHFGGVPHVKPSGEVEMRPKRTTTKNEHGKRDVLRGKPFADFVAFVESECASRGVFIVEKWDEVAA